MTQDQAIETLRMALAAIWTAIESEPWDATTADCQAIADEALDLTAALNHSGRTYSTETGMASWREFLQGRRWRGRRWSERKCNEAILPDAL